MNNYLEKTINVWKSKYSDFQLIRPIKSGKEALVYLVSTALIKKSEKYFALKIYKEKHLKTSNAEYIEGKHFRERSHRKAVTKKTKFGKELVQKLWTKREFYMLKKFHDRGANVPEVYTFNDNSILMEYIGDLNNPAPKLLNVSLSMEDAERFHKEILRSIDIFSQNGIVHGDLSEHNILWWNNEIYIIDFPQAIDIRKNPNADSMLQRDTENIKKFFSKYGV